MYTWPLRASGLGWLGIMAVAAALFDVIGSANAGLALLFGAIWWLLAFKLASEALTRAAAGREDDEGFEIFAGDGLALRQVLLGLGLLAAGVLLDRFAEPGALIAFCVALALLLPAIVVVLVMENSLVQAFDPRAWFELARRVGIGYFLLAAQLALLATAVVLTMRALPAAWPSWLAEAVAHVLFLYLLLVAYRALGVLLDTHRDALALAEDAPAVRPPGITAEEITAVAEADRLLAAGQAPAAVAVLDRLIRGRGASAPVHARFRELLSRLGDQVGLSKHARGYVAVLLQLGREREALALYLEARSQDPGFELDDAQPISDLIALAGGNQQSQLAVSLYEEFARRFPRDRDLVRNGLIAARLMDRLGREAEARTLLRDLQRRFPEHRLATELQAALDAVAR